MVDGKLTIVSPLEGSPAAQAGLEPGDIILAVDGEDISGMTLEGAVELIRGPEGSQVQLTIQDEDTGERREVTITRARIEIDQVIWAPIPGTPYAMLRVTAFSEGVSQELEAALIEIQGAGMEAVVLDLRNNSGGLLDEAVGVASEFLAEGDVLIRKDAEDQQQRVPREGDPQAPDLPLVVLANAGTASGAEVVAGALRDNGRALLVGMTTFGAGTVLNQFNLSDGSALLLATEEWLTPMGDRIWQRGIPPDVEVSLPEGGSPLDPDALEEMDAESFRNSQDTQLLRAVELLRTGETS